MSIIFTKSSFRLAAERKSRKATFLSDENIPLYSVKYLQSQGIDIVGILDLASGGLQDERVLELAFNEDRILITFDKDFGELVFRHNRPSKGVVLLRFSPQSAAKIAKSISDLISLDIDLRKHFTVMEKERIRTIPI